VVAGDLPLVGSTAAFNALIISAEPAIPISAHEPENTEIELTEEKNNVVHHQNVDVNFQQVLPAEQLGIPYEDLSVSNNRGQDAWLDSSGAPQIQEQNQYCDNTLYLPNLAEQQAQLQYQWNLQQAANQQAVQQYQWNSQQVALQQQHCLMAQAFQTQQLMATQLVALQQECNQWRNQAATQYINQGQNFNYMQPNLSYAYNNFNHQNGQMQNNQPYSNQCVQKKYKKKY